ncbi:MAG: hypothetical protein JNL60_10385 [Bacteroidia bacterium]|nr:hypothetical protein [Bacteroidia bacterium]
MNEIPNPNPCVTGNTSHQYAVWNGPQASAGVNNMFTGDKIIGYINTCNSVGYIAIDFASTSFGSTQKTNLYNSLSNLFNGPGLAGTHTTSSIFMQPSSNQTDCSSSELKVDFGVYNGSTLVASYPAKITGSFLNGKMLQNCQSPNGGPINYTCGNLPNTKVNPFVKGIKGNWRVKSQYSYLTDRVQNISSGTNGTNTDIRKDGYYKSFRNLYLIVDSASTTPPYRDWTIQANSGNYKWVNTLETTKYNEAGIEVETKDALGRYSSAVYGYNDMLPVAVASNAQLREIGFDGFEDYDLFTQCTREPHFAFRKAVLLNYAQRNSQHAHTGKWSLCVSNTANNVTMYKSISATQQQAATSTNYVNYMTGDVDFVYPFYPVSSNAAGNIYLVSYWVKEYGAGGTPPLDYTNNSITVKQANGTSFTTGNYKRSTIIDGWQRVEFTFTIPYGFSGPLNISLVNSSSNSNQKAYFDDIRIHPANSKMKSFVYNPSNLKYMAELDENNYASFYEYDDQGNLVRVKKETEKGIMTLKESKTHYAN